MATIASLEQFSSSQLDALAEAGRRELARRHLLDFMRYCWWMPDPLLEGLHTRAICDRLTRAVDDFEAGISTFLCIEVIFRHGKSDIGSRAFPAYFLGRCAARQPDLIIDSYGADLSESFSRKVQAIVQSDQYGRVFPGVRISKVKSAAYNWQIEGSAGEVTVAGVSGGFTGKGGALLVGDDLFKNREEAESEPIREKVWDHVRNDLITRRAPVSITLFMGTPWHVDDHFGRIRKEMATNPKFPRFEFIKFPGQSPAYPSGTLFPERFSRQWYEEQRAILGSYAASALMDCEPAVRGGNMIKTDKIQFADSMPAGLMWVRFWDLASTIKERAKDSPDFTVGTLVAVRVQDGAPWIYIDDCRYCQEEAPRRNAMIIQTAKADGPGVWQCVEGVAGYKDAYSTLKDVLAGVAVVHKADLDGDKVVRAGRMEPSFEAGHIVMRRGEWNDWLIRDLSQFPKGTHDDGTDSVSGGYAKALERWKSVCRDGAGEAFTTPTRLKGGF